MPEKKKKSMSRQIKKRGVTTTVAIRSRGKKTALENTQEKGHIGT